MSRITLHLQAKSDLNEAAAWYEAHDAGLGRRFLESVNDCLTRVAAHPLAYPLGRGRARRALVQTFPNAVFYILDEDTVLVVACLHTSRGSRVRDGRTRF
jgi:toxin ParE1/3/4